MADGVEQARFIRALPAWVPDPELSMSENRPDELDLDWYAAGPEWTLSVVIERDGEFYWAALVDGESPRGHSKKIGAAAGRQAILDILARLYPVAFSGRAAHPGATP